MKTIPAKENLNREIGVRSLALAIINITAGSGIFVIPAIIAEGLGATAILAYFVCGFLICLIGLCFAELGSKTTISGGVYTYIETAFGPYAGFLANNIYWLGGSVMSDAAIANALANTLQYFFPILSMDIVRIVFLFLVFGGLAVLNIRSVKNGIRFIEFATLGKLIPMILLVIVAAGFVDPENLKWEVSPTASNIGAASLLLFFAFLGLDGPLSNGGEMKNPRRTVPLGIFFGIGGVLLLYISIQLVTQGVLGADIVVHKNAPLAGVATIALGKTGAILIIAATALSMFGALGGELLSIPRILFAGARDGLMPKPLAKVHPVFRTPYIAIAVYAGFGFLLAISGGFKQLATIASAALLIIYLGVVLASIKLRKLEPVTTEKTFRLPGGVILPLVASAGILWLLSNLTGSEIIGIGIFILVFSLIYLGLKLARKKTIAVLIISGSLTGTLQAQQSTDKSELEAHQTVSEHASSDENKIIKHMPMKKYILVLIITSFPGLLQAQDSASFKFSVDHLALSVKDVNRSAEFYLNVMKLTEITNRSKIEGIRWFVLSDGRELHLISVIKENVIVNKALHLGLSSGRFDDFVNRLIALKIPYSDWPGKANKVNVRADGIKQVFFQDPDGYWLEVNSLNK